MLRFVEAFLLLALQACGVAISEEAEPVYMVDGETVSNDTIQSGRDQINKQTLNNNQGQDSSGTDAGGGNKSNHVRDGRPEDEEENTTEFVRTDQGGDGTTDETTETTGTVTYTVSENPWPTAGTGRISGTFNTEGFLEWGPEKVGGNPIDPATDYSSWNPTCPDVGDQMDPAKKDVNQFNPFYHRNEGYRSPGYLPPQFPQPAKRLVGFLRNGTADAPECRDAGLGRVELESVTVDGRMDEWQGRGLVRWDRYGDGALGHPSMDIIGLYAAKTDAAWNLFVMTGREFRAAPPGSRMNLYIYGSKPSDRDTEKEHSMNFVQKLVILPDGSIDADAADSGYYRVASGPDGVEIQILRDTFPHADKGLPVIKLSVRHDCGPSDKTSQYWFSTNDGPSCLVDLPGGGVKVVGVSHEDGIDQDVVMAQARTTGLAMALVEEVTGDHLESTDTMMVYSARYIDAGGYYHGWGNFIEYGPWIGLSLAAHEYAHAFNAGVYFLPGSWGYEGHSDLVELWVEAVYFGVPAVPAKSTVDWVRDIEGKDGFIDLGNWVRLSGKHYAKAELFHAHLLRHVGADRYFRIMKGKRDAKYVGQGWKAIAHSLEDFTRVEGFPGSSDLITFGGWFSADRYQESFGDLMTYFSGEGGEIADEDGDGIADTAEVELNLAPEVPLEAESMTLIADQYPGDWQRATNLEWLDDGGDTSLRCEVDFDVTRGAVVVDGTSLLFAMDVDVPPDWSKVRAEFFGSNIETGETRPAYGFSYFNSQNTWYYYFKDGQGQFIGDERFWFRPMSGRFIEWGASLSHLFREKTIRIRDDSRIYVSFYYDGTFCDTLALPVQHLDRLEFL